MSYVADFETTTKLDDCRVWAWAVSEIGNEENVIIGTDMESFFLWCMKQKNETIYFHNLKFDGEFMIHHLLDSGFKHVEDRKQAESNCFTTLISDSGQFYSIEAYYYKKKRHVRKTTFYDSLKILPFSVSQIAKDFHLPISKLELDYQKERPVGYQLTKEEEDYITNDVKIVAMALHQLFDQGLTKMTTAGNAMYDYKCRVGKKFDYWFPKLSVEVDEEIRKSYHGGWTYCKPDIKDKDIGEGIVLDVNSLYPSRMVSELLPYGEPIPFEGRYKKVKEYPLYVQKISCCFELKEGHLPTVQIKNNYRFVGTEYLTSSDGELVDLTMTNVDLKLFFDHYHVTNRKYQGGYMFKGQKGMFDAYVNHWAQEKITAKKEKNYANYIIAKLMQNSLYGKFALNPRVMSKYPYLSKEGKVKYELSEVEYRDSVYIPVASFITSYARNLTIRSAQAVYDRFLYADTDSLHLTGLELPKGLEIDEFKLGAWDHEATFVRSRYLRAKTYIEDVWDKNHETHQIKVTCAGLPDEGKQEVTWENFHPGQSYGGKLRIEHVTGGIVLVDTMFTIK